MYTNERGAGASANLFSNDRVYRKVKNIYMAEKIPHAQLPQFAVSNKFQTQSANRERDDLIVQEATSQGPIKRSTKKLAVNTVKSSSERKTTTIIDGYVTEAGELYDSARVAHPVAVSEEQLLETAYCMVSPDGSVAENLDASQDKDYKPSHRANCCDCLFQVYTCSVLSELAKRTRKSPVVSTIETFAAKSLRKAQALGKKTIAVSYNVYTPTLLGSLIRDIKVYGYFLIMSIMFINEVVGFVIDLKYDDHPEDDKLRLAKLIFSIISLVLACIDAIHQARVQKCESRKRCLKWVREVRKRINNPDLPKSPATENDSPQKEDAFDVFRIVVHEMVNYPNLILSIFLLLVQIVYKNGEAEPTTYLSVILNLLNAVFFMYIARWLVFVASFYSIRTIRNDKEPFTLKHLLSTSSARFHIAFVLGYVYTETF